MRAKFIYEKFTQSGDPIKQMGIGDKGRIIKQTLEKLASKNGFKSNLRPNFIDEKEIEEYGYNDVKIINSWYKEGEEDFIEITLYSFKEKGTKEIKYGIFECYEGAVDMGNEIVWPDSVQFTNDYWGKEFY